MKKWKANFVLAFLNCRRKNRGEWSRPRQRPRAFSLDQRGRSLLRKEH